MTTYTTKVDKIRQLLAADQSTHDAETQRLETHPDGIRILDDYQMACRIHRDVRIRTLKEVLALFGNAS